MKKLIFALSLITAQTGLAQMMVECNAAYRKSDTVGFSDKAKWRVEVLGSGEFVDGYDGTRHVGPFTIDVYASTGETYLSISNRRTKRGIYKTLYQSMRNLDNNHGFTGLQYVGAPTGPGWMNVYCKFINVRRR